MVVGAALLLIAELDRLTGTAPVQHLYYLPIILASIKTTWRGGLAAAFAAVLLYHLTNYHLGYLEYGESDIVQIVLFPLVSIITARLADDAAQLRLLAATDDLTGLHNLRSFEARLEDMVKTARAEHTPLSLLVLDLDHLKSLNDKYGHLTGAEAVRTVGLIIATNAPHESVACRYGGDEFVIALPRASRSEVMRVAEDLIHLVRKTPPTLAGRAFSAGTLSVSIGVAYRTFTNEAEILDDKISGENLFKAADLALYAAKKNGRNCVCEL